MNTTRYSPSKGQTINTDRCRASVWRACGRLGSTGQCSFRAIIDGEWCKIHAPADLLETTTMYKVGFSSKDRSWEIREVEVVESPASYRVVKGEEHVSYNTSIRKSDPETIFKTRLKAAQAFHRQQLNDSARLQRKLDEAIEMAEAADVLVKMETQARSGARPGDNR